MAVCLGWFPPAPSEAPAGIVDLAPDDWALEVKINGCRVIVSAGQVWTRQGTPLSRPKGAQRVLALAGGLGCTVEGEWVNATGKLWLFDLPDHPGSYDERRAALSDLLSTTHYPLPTLVGLVPRALGSFAAFYAACKIEGFEGVVAKRRLSHYPKCPRPDTLTRDWLKRRFAWD